MNETPETTNCSAPVNLRVSRAIRAVAPARAARVFRRIVVLATKTLPIRRITMGCAFVLAWTMVLYWALLANSAIVWAAEEQSATATDATKETAPLELPSPRSGSEKVQEAGDASVIEDVEDVEAVEIVEEIEALPGEESNDFGLLQIVGRNHPALVHIPIGFVLAVVLIELLTLLFPRIDPGRSGFILSLATVVSFLPAIISGWLRSLELFATVEAPMIFLEHRNMMILGSIVFTVGTLLRIFRRDQLEGATRVIYLALLILSLVLVALGGHHGGELVYGEDFLPY